MLWFYAGMRQNFTRDELIVAWLPIAFIGRGLSALVDLWRVYEWMVIEVIIVLRMNGNTRPDRLEGYNRKAWWSFALTGKLPK